MVHEKTTWKWHQCLQVYLTHSSLFIRYFSFQARYELLTYDSECENDDYPDINLIMEDKQGK